jgi:hypothetical protein
MGGWSKLCHGQAFVRMGWWWSKKIVQLFVIRLLSLVLREKQRSIFLLGDKKE